MAVYAYLREAAGNPKVRLMDPAETVNAGTTG